MMKIDRINIIYFQVGSEAVCNSRSEEKLCKKLKGTQMSIKSLAEKGNEEMRARICPHGHGLITLTGVLDCCTVCGKQINEVCDKYHPCDATLGLQCVHGDSKKSGTCKRK